MRILLFCLLGFLRLSHRGPLTFRGYLFQWILWILLSEITFSCEYHFLFNITFVSLLSEITFSCEYHFCVTDFWDYLFLWIPLLWILLSEITVAFLVNTTYVNAAFWDYLFLWISLLWMLLSEITFLVNTTFVNTAFWDYRYLPLVNTTFVNAAF